MVIFLHCGWYFIRCIWIGDMFNIAQVHRDAMREALVCAQEVTSKLTRAINTNNKMAGQVETSRKKATLTITQAFEQLHQTIEERKTTLLLEMEDTFQDKNSDPGRYQLFLLSRRNS